jgi:predicted transposase YdaD
LTVKDSIFSGFKIVDLAQRHIPWINSLKARDHFQKKPCLQNILARGNEKGNIMEEECGREKIGTKELISGSRRRKVSALRARIAKRGPDELGLSLAELARHAGVNTSSIAKAMARAEETA